jgi:hypothetical protein
LELIRERLGIALDRHVGRRVGRAAIRLSARSWRAIPSNDAAGAVEARAYGFDVYTFVTDEAHYEAMRASFAASGMEPPLARFVRLTADGDPFRAIGRLFATSAQRCAILCHQDVRLGEGAGAKELLAALAQLDALDPGWAVAGTAGVTNDLRLVRRLTDPYGASTPGVLPARVVSLDENFLVFNPRRAPRCSIGLSGFHFYGTDVCLNAAAKGGAAYVIDFPLTHLSAGRFDDGYRETRDRLRDVWNGRFVFRYVGTTTELVFLSRSQLLQRLFGSERAMRWVRAAAPKHQ